MTWVPRDISFAHSSMEVFPLEGAYRNTASDHPTAATANLSYRSSVKSVRSIPFPSTR